MPEPVGVICADGVSIDNLSAAIAAAHTLSIIRELIVIVSPRPVNRDPDAPITSYDAAESHRVHLLNAARMVGALRRAGYRTPVYLGLSVAEAGLTTTIPHHRHVDERRYDLHGDYPKLIGGQLKLAGRLEDAIAYLKRTKGPIHPMMCGPYTDLSAIMQVPDLYRRLGVLAGQGTFGLSKRTMFGNEAFNIAVARPAALAVRERYPSSMHLISSDETRHPQVSFSNALEMANWGICREIVDLYGVHQQQTGQPQLSIHDSHVIFMMNQLLRRGRKVPRLHTEAKVTNPASYYRMVGTYLS